MIAQVTLRGESTQERQEGSSTGARQQLRPNQSSRPAVNHSWPETRAEAIIEEG